MLITRLPYIRNPAKPKSALTLKIRLSTYFSVRHRYESRATRALNCVVEMLEQPFLLRCARYQLQLVVWTDHQPAAHAAGGNGSTKRNHICKKQDSGTGRRRVSVASCSCPAGTIIRAIRARDVCCGGRWSWDHVEDQVAPEIDILSLLPHSNVPGRISEIAISTDTRTG